MYQSPKKVKEMKAYVFPGQGAQYVGMGKDLYENHAECKAIFDTADEVLGFKLSEVMFDGTEEDLKATRITQPALFVHSIASLVKEDPQDIAAVAGHSLGEFSALVASKCLDFSDALRLVYARAMAMQEACDQVPGTMAAILGMENEAVEKICADIPEVVVAANYNCPGQLVISGSEEGIDKAIQACTEAGARRALKLPVGGAFHSPLMQPAKEKLAKAIEETSFSIPVVPIYQNVTAQKTTDPQTIKQNLIDQLTGAVKWTQIMENMIADGVSEIVEVGGNGKVLSGLFKKVDRKFPTSAI